MIKAFLKPVSFRLHYYIIFAALAVVGFQSHAAELSETCQEFVKQLPPGFKWGTVQVPEDYAKPEKMIEVFYFGNYTGKKAPIIYINGGPGIGNDLVWRAKFKGFFEKLADPNEFEYVFFDQRGTHCSSAYPINPLELDRLKNYGAREIAKDAEAIRQKVVGKDGRAIIWGQSFGSLVALKYYELFPQTPVSIVTTGQVGMAEDFMAQRYINAAQAVDQYFALHPEDRARFLRLKSMLNSSHCVDSAVGPVCGPILVDAFAILHLAHPNGDEQSWDSMHQFISTYFADDKAQITPDLLTALAAEVADTVELIFADADDSYANTFLFYLNVSGVDPLHSEEAARQSIMNYGIDPKQWIMSELPLQEKAQAMITDPKFLQFSESLKSVAPDTIKVKSLRQALVKTPQRNLSMYISCADSMAPPEAVHMMARKVQAEGALPNLRVIEKDGGHGLDMDLDVIRQIWKMEN